MYPSSNCASKRSRDKLAALSLVHSKVPDTRHIPAKHYRPLLNKHSVNDIASYDVTFRSYVKKIFYFLCFLRD